MPPIEIEQAFIEGWEPKQIAHQLWKDEMKGDSWETEGPFLRHVHNVLRKALKDSIELRDDNNRLRKEKEYTLACPILED
jgi:16S rRNA U1498 N3-methylase RsmE